MSKTINVLSAVLLFFSSYARGQVSSDVLPLQSAIILPPGNNLRTATYKLYEDSPSSSPMNADEAIEQHRAFVDLLKKNNIQVLNVLDLLQNAVANARKEGEWEQAVSEMFPGQFSSLKPKLEELTPEALLGRSEKFFYDLTSEGFFQWLIPVSSGFFYTRDFAVSTPKGIILTSSRARKRKMENPIGRFLFHYSDELRKHEIAFDANAEGMRCEGGDIIVQDEKTLLMGVDHLSDRAVAKKIAVKLNMDVIAVAMPPAVEYSGANIEILHLDTVFNIVDTRKVLTVPYLFLKKYEKSNPVVEFLRKIENRPNEAGMKAGSLQRAIDVIPHVGWITLFRAGTGEEKELKMKLGDYMVQQGYEIIPVGGIQGDLDNDQYINERVLYELSLQAANVLQIKPGKVIAFAHNRYTNDELRKRGVEVLTFAGSTFVNTLGGPHCLAMPLTRR